MSNNIFNYKGYHGTIEADPDEDYLYGKLLFINDHVDYRSDTVFGLKAEFKDSVNEYIKTCEELGIEPKKPFKGSFNVRIGEKLHQQAAIEAKLRHISLNQLMSNAIETELELRSGH